MDSLAVKKLSRSSYIKQSIHGILLIKRRTVQINLWTSRNTCIALLVDATSTTLNKYSSSDDPKTINKHEDRHTENWSIPVRMLRQYFIPRFGKSCLCLSWYAFLLVSSWSTRTPILQEIYLCSRSEVVWKYYRASSFTLEREFFRSTDQLTKKVNVAIASPLLNYIVYLEISGPPIHSQAGEGKEIVETNSLIIASIIHVDFFSATSRL